MRHVIASMVFAVAAAAATSGSLHAQDPFAAQRRLLGPTDGLRTEAPAGNVKALTGTAIPAELHGLSGSSSLRTDAPIKVRKETLRAAPRATTEAPAETRGLTGSSALSGDANAAGAGALATPRPSAELRRAISGAAQSSLAGSAPKKPRFQ